MQENNTPYNPLFCKQYLYSIVLIVLTDTRICAGRETTNHSVMVNFAPRTQRVYLIKCVIGGLFIRLCWPANGRRK